ncbi:hypothetical protein MRB53_036911 [Persea americana]|nr:hypothetical protein MRB53_036911 [Persea americana]
MIEQLVEHEVRPSDLTPTLMANARVKNPVIASQGAAEQVEEESGEKGELSIDATLQAKAAAVDDDALASADPPPPTIR